MTNLANASFTFCSILNFDAQMYPDGRFEIKTAVAAVLGARSGKRKAGI